jgi:hypothetical protein
MEITQQELGTYTPFTNVPFTDVPALGRRVRILSCVNNQPPIISFTLYEGTVQTTIHNPAVFSNQIILHPGAISFVVFNRVNTGNGPAPLTNGNIQFPFDAWDFNLYYWKYIDEANYSIAKKYNPDSYPSLKRERSIEPDPIKRERVSINSQTRRKLFAGKYRRKTKRRKSLK